MLLDLIGDTDFDMVKHVRKELQRVPVTGRFADPTLDVVLVSEGGSVCGGLAVYDFLHSPHLNVTISTAGICASAATIVLQAGKLRRAWPSTQFLLHYVSTETDDPDLKAIAPYLDAQVGLILTARMGEANYKKAREMKSFNAQKIGRASCRERV